uniref:Reverse transcriptase Ty1/copia-type domain-containing protein n=1 Tax=Fagus sylvatica TaxID=28930 RepID=A0A2N9IEX9_FAGSY
MAQNEISAIVASAHSGSTITLTTDQLEDIIAQALVWAGNASSSSALSILPSKFSFVDPRTGQELGTGRRIGRLFEISSLRLPATGVSATTSSSSSLSFWHSRLGHASSSWHRLFIEVSQFRPSFSLSSLSDLFPEVSTHSPDLFPPSPEVSTFIPQTESSDHSFGSSSDVTPHSLPESPALAPATTLRRSFRATMTEELDALSRNRTWDLVDLPPEQICGFTQEYGIDYEETFALVARLSSVRLLVVAASRQWKLFQMNVKNAFLNRDLSEEVYMQPPPGSFSSTCSYDSAIFLRRTDKGTILLLLYVDNMIITGDDLSGIQELKDFLTKYTFDLLSRASLTDHKIGDTPIKLNAHLTASSGELLPNPTLYRQLVSNLFYLTVTRPDISYAVHQGTLFHGLHFSAQSPFILKAYSDVDWAGNPPDRRSTTGYCFLLSSSWISWRSKKQSVVARFSTEAEYRALADTTFELL